MFYRSTYCKALIAVVLTMGNSISIYAQDLKVVRFSKEQLQAESEQTFLKPRNLGSIVVSNLRDLAVTLTERQSGKNSALRDLALSARQPSDQIWMKKMASLSFDPSLDDSRLDEGNLRKTFGLQSRKAAEVNLKRNFPIWQQFKNGLTLNLNVGKTPSSQTSTDSRDIRYGLVERDILPGDQAINLAMFGNIDDLDWVYSTKAKVIYTIDRIDTEAQHPSPGRPNDFESSPDVGPKWTTKPSSKMTIKIDAATNDDSLGDQVLGGGFPGARVTLKEFEGLVSTQFVIGNKAIEKTLTTEISAPLYGGMKLSQKMDGKFALTETSAQNILGTNQSSQLNIYYSRVANSLRGEWQLGMDGINYSLTAESVSLLSPNRLARGNRTGDKVSVALQKSF